MTEVSAFGVSKGLPSSLKEPAKQYAKTKRMPVSVNRKDAWRILQHSKGKQAAKQYALSNEQFARQWNNTGYSTKWVGGYKGENATFKAAMHRAMGNKFVRAGQKAKQERANHQPTKVIKKSAFGVIHKSFIPGVGYVSASKAGKETLKRAAKIRQSPNYSGNRPGPTANDESDRQKILAALNMTPKGTPHIADQIRQGTIASGQKPLHQYTPKEIADKGPEANDINRTKKALKRLYGKKGDKGVVLSPANGPVEQATQFGPYSNVAARTISAGKGFSHGSEIVRAGRLSFRQPKGKGQIDQTQGMEAQKRLAMMMAKDGTGTKGHARLAQDVPKTGAPGKLPGGKFAPKAEHPLLHGNDADAVARHEGVHQSQGKAKLRRKLKAGHITAREFDLALAARAVRHNRKAAGKGPSYSTKEEARADAITRQTGDTPDGKNFLSGHDHEEGFVQAHNKVVQGLNRTEKKRRKQGRGRNDFVEKVPYAGT